MHPLLLKFEEKVLQDEGISLIPLAGKTVDMLYLATQGQRVVGVEHSQVRYGVFVTLSAREQSNAQHIYLCVGTDAGTPCLAWISK